MASVVLDPEQPARAPAKPAERKTKPYMPAVPASSLLRELLSGAIIPTEDWDKLPAEVRDRLLQGKERGDILSHLVEHGLLTPYQADRIDAGNTFGLLLGNYRVLDGLGVGGMGVVFKAEHILMRRIVAVKVLAQGHDHDPRMLLRFFAEMRAVARLNHPNIVTAMDAGSVVGKEFDRQVLHYLVMEYVAGQNLEDYVNEQGPLSPAKACDLIYQVACALSEAHKHHLVHRDIKPSNVMITHEDQAKLLDFGLVHHFGNRLTAPSITLGTVEYMAPEQARDAGTVDIRADIYGLGGILFWCLTGRGPFPPKGGVTQELILRQNQPPPSVRAWRPDIPAEFDAVVARMMALDADDRYPHPEAVMRALLPFLRPELRDHCLAVQPRPVAGGAGLRGGELTGTRSQQILIVDDERNVREFCRYALESEGFQCDAVANGALGLEAVGAKHYDLLLLDVDMPEMSGPELCRRLRETPPDPNLKIIMFSGRATGDEMAKMLSVGADDFISKPFSFTQLQARVKSALRLKEAQDRSDVLTRHLLAVTQQLEENLTARDSDLVRARNALVLALAKCVEYRDGETGSHLLRMQRYARCLAEEAAASPLFAGQIDPNYVQNLECCVPLYDFGKIGLPDHILLKPGKLSADERMLMQAHTTIGANTLKTVAERQGFCLAFLQMAIDIARHHHERFDGSGYPDHLAGSDIPLAARLVAIADVYDALRSRRIYKPALSHAAALQIMTENSPGQFDPALIQFFQRCAPEFDRIYRELPN